MNDHMVVAEKGCEVRTDDGGFEGGWIDRAMEDIVIGGGFGCDGSVCGAGLGRSLEVLGGVVDAILIEIHDAWAIMINLDN